MAIDAKVSFISMMEKEIGGIVTVEQMDQIRRNVVELLDKFAMTELREQDLEDDDLLQCYLDALKVLNRGGVIVMHDCHPQTEEMQEPYRGQFFWTGDVWKAFVQLRGMLAHEMYVIDQDFGCGIIDTKKRRKTPPPQGIVNMKDLTYRDFVEHPEWMDFRQEWRDG